MIALTCGTAACAKAPATTVRARFGAGHPLVGLAIDAVPFDPDLLLDSLARVAPRPKPQFPTLEQTLLSYHRPKPGASLTGPAAVWLATQDSAIAVADSLRRINRKAPGYAAAFDRFRALYQRMVERQRSSDGGRTGAIPEEDRRLADRAAKAADSLRAWEDMAYAGYPAAARQRLDKLGRDVVHVETDTAGTAVLVLAPGTWWLMARLPDADNPFAERVWRLPITASAGRSLTVPLFEGNYALAWRH